MNINPSKPFPGAVGPELSPKPNQPAELFQDISRQGAQPGQAEAQNFDFRPGQLQSSPTESRAIIIVGGTPQQGESADGPPIAERVPAEKVSFDPLGNAMVDLGEKGKHTGITGADELMIKV